MVPSKQRTVAQVGAGGTQRATPPTTRHAAPARQETPAQEDSGTLLVILEHLGHPRSTRHGVVAGQRSSRQEGTRRHRGHPLRTLQAAPVAQRRFRQEGLETQAGWPWTRAQEVPGAQARWRQEEGTEVGWPQEMEVETG